MSSSSSSSSSSNNIPQDMHVPKKARRGTSQFGMYQDIEDMMVGFGDKFPPNPESVDLMEKIAVNYIRNLCQRAREVAELSGSLDKECFMYAVRKDRRKFTRVYSLLKTNEELKTLHKTEISEETDHK